MQTYVINLDRAEKKLSTFIENNTKYLKDFKRHPAVDGKKITNDDINKLGLPTLKSWRDPILKRTLTHGEIGCFLSHWQLWDECAMGDEAFLIFEDDVIVERELPDNLEEQAANGILFLLWNEMSAGGSIDQDDYWELVYPYWLCAYVLTPTAAKHLIGKFRHIIPADEYVPYLSDWIELRGIKDTPCRLASQGSSTEPKSHNDYFIDFDTHFCTVASDKDKAEKLFKSAERFNIPVVNLWPEDQEWNGGLQNFQTGGGIKLNLLKKYLKDIPDHDLVVFTDAYDVFYGDTAEEITRRFLSFKTEVLVQAERHNWPDPTSQWPPSHTPYRYLCSGVIIGRAGELKRIISRKLKPDESDQLFLQGKYLWGKFSMKLDREMYVSASNDDAIEIKNESIFNPLTKCYSCIYHGNGGAEAKSNFDKLYDKMFPVRNYLETRRYEIIGPEMWMVDYKTPEQCQEWIDIAEAHGGFEPHPFDKFPSHDIHLKKLGLMEEADDFFTRIVKPIAETYWSPMLHQHLRKAFVMKYSSDTQLKLGLHTDSSQITGSVKLNDDYTGAVLHWPRQGVSNKDIPVGKMIVFPGMVTHGHYVDPLTSGTKYSATFWTARYKNEYL